MLSLCMATSQPMHPPLASNVRVETYFGSNLVSKTCRHQPTPRCRPAKKQPRQQALQVTYAPACVKSRNFTLAHTHLALFFENSPARPGCSAVSAALESDSPVRFRRGDIPYALYIGTALLCTALHELMLDARTVKKWIDEKPQPPWRVHLRTCDDGKEARNRDGACPLRKMHVTTRSNRQKKKLANTGFIAPRLPDVPHQTIQYAPFAPHEYQSS